MTEKQLKRLEQYKRILIKEPVLFDTSEKIYKTFADDTANSHLVQRGIATYVIAPIVYSFVSWVLRDALLRGKKRLYFLARDGYVMYHIAEMICKEIKLPIECKYLYCSRYALRSAQFSILSERSLDYICLGGMDVTFEKIMDRAGLDENEAGRTARILGYQKKRTDEMSYNEVKSMKKVLKDCSYFMEKVYEHSRENYPLVIGYLKQEGFLEDVPFAIVDSGWTGSMQKSLQSLLNSMDKASVIEGYYFGMYEYPMEMKKENYHCYYFKPEKFLRRKVYFSNNLFECIYSSPEGMVTGYRVEKDKYIPVFEHPDNPNKERINYHTKVIKEYTKEMLVKNPRDIWEDKKNFLDIAEKLFFYFMGKPTVEEAREYGKYVFCDDVIGEKEQTVAASLSCREIKDNFLLSKSINMLTKKGRPIKESAWLEGSIMLNQDMGMRKLKHCALCKYALYIKKRMK